MYIEPHNTCYAWILPRQNLNMKYISTGALAIRSIRHMLSITYLWSHAYYATKDVYVGSYLVWIEYRVLQNSQLLSRQSKLNQISKRNLDSPLELKSSPLENKS